MSLLEGMLVGGGQEAGHAYAVVLPSGRRFQVSEPLYRLVELLRSDLAADEVAARLAARLGRPLSADDVGALVVSRLAPHGVVSQR